MITILIQLVDILTRVLSLLVIVHVFLGYFLSPFHPVRSTIARLIEPLLAPIRRLLPTMAGIDFSPFALILIIQLLKILLMNILVALL
jgi:YggT family protein